MEIANSHQGSRHEQDFVRQQLIGYFGIDQHSEERPQGMRRNPDNHSDTFKNIADHMLAEKRKFNKRKESQESGKLTFGRHDVPHIMRALSQQGLIGYADTYKRAVLVEAQIPIEQAVEQLDAEQ